MLIRHNNKGYLFLVLLLMASPALSVTGLLGIGFLPNEKLAFLMVFLSKLSWKREGKQLRYLGLICALILTCLFLIQIFTGNVGEAQASINSIFIIASIPFYYSFLSSNPRNVLKYIFFIGILQTIVSLIQQYYTLNLDFISANMFNNYPGQSTYEFPLGETGFFFRTSGLFFESSGYSIFQWLAIVSAFSIGIHKKIYGKILIFIMISELILNGSLTGYLFAFGFFGINFIVRSSYSKRLIFNFIFLFIFFLMTIYFLHIYDYFNLTGFYTKIIGQFDFMSNVYSYQPSRFKGMLYSITNTLNSEYMLFGTGFTWLYPTLDIYSLYFKAYGFIGLLFILLFISALLRQAPLNYKVAVFLVLSVNGHLSTVINILLLSMPLLFFKIKQEMNTKKI